MPLTCFIVLCAGDRGTPGLSGPKGDQGERGSRGPAGTYHKPHEEVANTAVITFKSGKDASELLFQMVFLNETQPKRLKDMVCVYCALYLKQ